MSDELKQRKEKLLKYLNDKKSWVIYVALAFMIWFSYKIRTSNLGNLIDSTTGKYIPLALDPFAFLRYAKELLETGTLATVDMLRYYPDGYLQVGEFSLLSNFVVSLYKFFHFFNSNVTLEYVHIIYPALAFSITLVFFFLLVRKLFDWKIGLLATAYLIVIPIFLYRTVSGFSDKESFSIMLFMISLYFYVSAWMGETKFKSVFYGLLSGLFTGLMGLTWGGVSFMFLIISLFTLMEIMLDKFTNNDLYTFASWSISSFLIISIFSGRFPLKSLLMAPLSGIVIFVLLMGIVQYLINNFDLFKLKNKLKDKIPLGLFNFFVVTLFVLVVLIIFTGGFDFIITTVKGQIEVLTSPLGGSRWGVTVAESHQPYLVDILGQLGNYYFMLFLAGSVLLFYNMVKNVKKYKFKLTFVYILFIVSFLFSRYSPSATLNGVNNISLFLYFGSILFFLLIIFALYIYSYKKDKETYENILSINKVYIFLFVWFIIKIIAARSMSRLIMLLAPITVILVAYLFITILNYALKQKNLIYRYFLIVLVLILLFNPAVKGSLTDYYHSTTGTARSVGPSYNQQWQQAMGWVRENTPEDAVFAAWWDYGYWIQTGGERATVSDGGNVGGVALNYFTARNLLTSPDEIEALKFMKAKEANYFLTLSDDIGKYPAYSSIGSDLENDRYSWINVFYLDPSKTHETRNQTTYVYTGSVIFDEDIEYGDNLFPGRASGIAGFFVPMIEQDGAVTLTRPIALVAYNNQQIQVPMNCVIFNKERAVFGNDGLDACLMIMPTYIEGNRFDPKGAAMYLSGKVKDGMFARLYLNDQKIDNFELVYSDEAMVPLAVYHGRLYGPLKIWKVTYPPGLEVDEMLKRKSLPDPRLIYAV